MHDRHESSEGAVTPSDEPTYFDGSIWEDGRPVLSFAVDDVAFAARARSDEAPPATCHVCSDPVESTSTSGLLVWTRDDEVRFEEPPLCPACATTIRAAAWMRWSTDLVD